MADFEDKVVIVTGASSGIGRATAKLFAKHGAKVVLVGRNVQNLAAAADECIAVGHRDKVLTVAADLTKLDDLKRIVDETVHKFKTIDVLVNNAGGTNMETLLTATLQGYEDMMNLNVRAPFFLIKHAEPYLAETKGNIVNVSAIAALRGLPFLTVYSMAKAALEQLTRAACAELAPKGIRVNTVNPGIIKTNFAEAAGFRNLPNHEAAAARMIEQQPIRRLGEPEEIAECILFVASSKASFVDGICLLADGGRLNVA